MRAITFRFSLEARVSSVWIDPAVAGVSAKSLTCQGGGLWMPEAQPLALLRTNFDRKSKKLKRVLTQPQIRKHFLKGVANDERKAIKAFAAQNSENALKTRPKVRVHLFPEPLALLSRGRWRKPAARRVCAVAAPQWIPLSGYPSDARTIVRILQESSLREVVGSVGPVRFSQNHCLRLSLDS